MGVTELETITRLERPIQPDDRGELVVKAVVHQGNQGIEREQESALQVPFEPWYERDLADPMVR